MTTENLQKELLLQLEAMSIVVDELVSLREDIASREPSIREKTAAGSFMAQFYNGIENILKRITLYNEVPLPEGDKWHFELFQRFTSPPHTGLPALFDDELALSIAPYRRFRHLIFHSYGFQLEWELMVSGVEGVLNVYNNFKVTVLNYLNSLDS